MSADQLHTAILERIVEDSDGCEDTSAATIVDALRAVVELHAPTVDQFAVQVGADDVIGCSSCEHYMGGQAVYPCPTVRSVARALGIEADSGG